MKKWAKIHVIDGIQVLFYTEVDHVNNEDVIHQIVVIDDIRADMAISSKEDGWSDKMFNKVATRKQAKIAIKEVSKAIGGLEIESE